jgi:CheY-like chemotaxis protein
MDGHAVTIAESGADAITHLGREAFDVVITDLGMPDVTGWDVARETKQLQPNTRVGLVTGWGSELGDPDNVHALGVDFIVSKPYRIASIRNAIRDAVVQRERR